MKTIGARMKAARGLCNLSLSAAAERFGYSNPSKLCKVEGATDTNSVPLWLIFRASRVYEVSIDYLFGASEDWEVGARMTQEREVSAWMFEAMEKARKRDMSALKKLHDRVAAMDESIAFMLAAGDDVAIALSRFSELNVEFEDMRAGSRLVSSIERVTGAAKHAKAKMTKFHWECTIAASDTNQLSLSI